MTIKQQRYRRCSIRRKLRKTSKLSRRDRMQANGKVTTNSINLQSFKIEAVLLYVSLDTVIIAANLPII
jgi:hypothetical protein